MSITIQQNDKPDLDVCKMVCDRPLHKKLDDYDLTRDCLNKASTNLFIGKMGSGKTNLIYSFFKSKKLFDKVFHNIYLFQPPHSRASMKDKLFQNGIPDNQIYDELDYESLKTVADEIEEEDSKYNNIIIFDDQTVALKNKETLKLLKRLIFNHRHLNLTIYFLVQTYHSVPKEIRRLFSNIFCFRVSREELETIFSEVVEKRKNQFMEIAKKVFDKKYNWLMINTDSQRIFKMWDELIFAEDKEENIC